LTGESRIGRRQAIDFQYRRNYRDDWNMNFVATIIIPLKRQNDGWLDQCVRSAVSQDVTCEVIVIRAADTPPSNLAILESLGERWKNLRTLVEEKPGSFPGAINLGIRCSTSGRIGLLLSDDWLDRDAVAQCLPLSADIVCTGLTMYRENGVTIQEAASQTRTMEKFHSLPTLEAKANYLEHFFLFRKEALLSAGGLDESIGNYPGIDDYDLVWTMLERDATVAIVEKRLYNYRDHDGERLTLADARQASLNLEKILRKHQVPEAEIPRLVKAQARWFGRPIYNVMTEG
jgi:cellulose synthase/poly-beta-1,6-N-acetylglucosamine synthase-like glycosyltransferase